MITVEQISKNYGKLRALKEVSFEVQKGELFGLIGPDGAGKTTLFRILTSLMLPDKGRGMVAGWDCAKDHRQIRNHVGYMPGRFSLYQDLTIEENLTFFARVFKTTVKKNYHLIKDIYVQLEPFKNRRAGKLSGGMKQKLALCCALVHEPVVLFLDEPTTGVDAVSRKEFWEMLKGLKAKGISILVSTPYMDEASLCERIALIQEGNIMSVDTPEAIRQGFDKAIYSIESHHMHQLLLALRQNPETHSCYAFGQQVHWTVKGREDAHTVERVTAFLRQRGHEPVKIERIEAGIEDCFMELMQKQAST